ncbi:MAG: antibiotic biosynthesis monooxygenase [Pseudomonadota bacterium]
MVTIDVRHKVRDFERWKQMFDGAAGARRAAGELACRIYLRHGSADDVLVSMDWESLERAPAFLASPELAAGMQAAGVREMPQIALLRRVDHYAP